MLEHSVCLVQERKGVGNVMRSISSYLAVIPRGRSRIIQKSRRMSIFIVSCTNRTNIHKYADYKDTETQIRAHLNPSKINSSLANSTKPALTKENREGIFSSLPLAFFSPSVPSSTIDQFTSNGGITLPRLDAMELQYYLKSPLNEDHPFYHVDLIFVTGDEDLLGTVLSQRVLMYYDCGWVEKCAEKGGLLDMGAYVVDFPISKAQTASEEDQESTPINDITDPRTSDLHHISIYGPFTSRASSPRSDILFKYAVRTIPPSAFTSESATRDASFKSTISTATKLRAATAPFTRTRLSNPMNEVAGPSRFKDESETQGLGLAFIPFHSSSLRVSSERSVTPLLYIPYKELDQIKVREFEKRMKEFKVLDLEEFYQDLMKCGKDDKMIMELEPGLLG